MSGSFYFFLSLFFALAPISLPASAEVQRFRLDPDESRIVTRVDDPFGRAVEGTLRLREGEARGEIERLPDTGFFSLVIDAASYDTNLGMRDQDVRQNYLYVEEYPLIRIVSTGIENVQRPAAADRPWLLTVKARLDLHGVERELAVPVRVFYETRRIIAEGGFRFLLEDFDIPIPRFLFFRAGEEVEVEFRIVGDRQA